MSFSFVDRITDFEPRHARGQFLVPKEVARFPAALLVEAVGQLAGWVAMAATDFTRRPVAALAYRITLGRSLEANTVIDLAVDITRCDHDAVLYDGTASAAGTEITRLRRCLGPMLPLADFDAPEVVERRFEQLRTGGAARSECGDGREWSLVLHDEEMDDERATAVLRVPTDATFLADHFPRKPVLPATLLFDAQLRLAISLARSTMAVAPDAVLVARVLRDAKVRAFMTPGIELTLGAQVLAARSTGEFAVSAKLEGKQVASARVEISAQ